MLCAIGNSIKLVCVTKLTYQLCRADMSCYVSLLQCGIWSVFIVNVYMKHTLSRCQAGFTDSL